MTELVHSSLGSATVAAASTVHLAILLLLWHRSPTGWRYLLLLAPSLAAVASPWLFPTLPGLALGLALHVAWLAACARLVPVPAAAPAGAAGAQASNARPAPVTAGPARRGFVPATVIAVLPETADITTFRIARPSGFDFKPGQFLTVRVSVDGEHLARCYSISSAPHSIGFLEVSVKRQGVVSGTLHATVRPGSTLEVMAPAGGFSYPAGDQRPLVLLAGGVGITPMMSMLRHAVHAEPGRPVSLVYSVHAHGDIAFRDELRWLARRHPQVRVVITTTRGPRSADCLSGRIDGAMLTEHVPDLVNSIFMICGPGPMIDSLKEMLAALGVPEPQVRSEAFDLAVAMASKGAGAAAAAGGGAAYTLRLATSGGEVTARAGSTLLETCEAAGAVIPSACRAGVCGTCRARLLEGRVRCESDLLDDGERAEGYILPCVSWPESDCALEA